MKKYLKHVYVECPDGTLNVYDGRHWVYGVNRDDFFSKGNIIVNKRFDRFESSEGTRSGSYAVINKEVNFMARVVTIQQPVFAVQASVSTFVKAMPLMNDQDRALVWKHIREYGNLNVVVNVPCNDENHAKNLVSILNKYHRTVTVRSFTKHGVTYQVTVEDNGDVVSCTCPDFVHRSQDDPDHVCKHMEHVESYPSSYAL